MKTAVAIRFVAGNRRGSFIVGRVLYLRSFIMTFFTDFKDAIVDYPNTGVDLSIVSAVQNKGTGTDVNENEVWKFKVNVLNHGFLNMSNVMLHVNPKNGALVSTTDSDFDTGTITVGPLTVSSGNARDTDFVFFKAPKNSTSLAVDLVEAHIAEWDGDMDALLIGQSGHSNTPSATFSRQVFPK